MNLVVFELTATILQQEVTTGDLPIQLESVRPHLYKHLNPAGTLYIELRNAAGTLLKTSDPVLISDITAASGNYFHGYIKFDLKAGLMPNTNYKIRLVSTGYTYSGAAFIGWCNDFDLRKYPVAYSPNDGIIAPLDIEFWEMKQVRKGEL